MWSNSDFLNKQLRNTHDKDVEKFYVFEKQEDDNIRHEKNLNLGVMWTEDEMLQDDMKYKKELPQDLKQR